MILKKNRVHDEIWPKVLTYIFLGKKITKGIPFSRDSFLSTYGTKRKRPSFLPHKDIPALYTHASLFFSSPPRNSVIDFDQISMILHLMNFILFMVKISPFTNGVAEVKRPSSFLEPKATQATPKKSRLESRASCPPIKVHAQKLSKPI